MNTISFSLPAMYGDHHVLEVRRLLLGIEGVESVYASSAFGTVELEYNPDKIEPETIKTTLDRAGYLGDLALPVEGSVPVDEANGKGTYFRHSAAFKQTSQVVGFTQNVPAQSRPLWPCPGMGVLATIEE